MAGVLDVVKPIQHFVKFPKIWIDNTIFRLHAKVSVFLVLLCCMLITVGQFFGKPIDCIVNKDLLPTSVMNTYCWIHSTFTLPRRTSALIGHDSAHPGVVPVIDEGEVVQHKYYQWVCFTLFFQAMCFLAPYHLWKYWEGGKVSSILPSELTHTTTDKRMPSFPVDYGLISKKSLQLAVAKMKDYFITAQGQPYREHQHHFLLFTFCELLNFINVTLQIFFVDYFLGGVFTTYGSDVVAMSNEDPEDRTDPLNSVFPKVAKCTFQKYGPSGTVEKVDALCVLSLNIINEKIYILLWFWFLSLAILSGLQLVWRVATLVSGRLRESILRTQSHLFAQQSDITTVCNNLTTGDWFLLVQISDNIDSHIFAELLKQLATAFNKMVPNGLITTDV